jgi:hypothetical protein|tara:strand:- start:7091 stop:7633 length:543 start_codon:yes stop_codon:yes gene_type:complete
MKEIELSKKLILHGKLPLSLSSVNFDKIFEFINFATLDLKKRKLNRFNDIDIPLMQDIIWILDYAEGQFQLKRNKTLERKSLDVMVHGKGEGSLKRHHLNYPNLKDSPDIVLLYFIKSDNNEIIIEYDDNRKKDLYWTLPIEGNQYVLFNSNLEYYILPNKSDKQRIVLRATYDERLPLT